MNLRSKTPRKYQLYRHFHATFKIYFLFLRIAILFIAVEAKVRTLLNAEIQSEITSDFLLTRSAILRLLYVKNPVTFLE
ncbi:MAG: hypothetical protein MGF17_05740 [Trichodesmium sp. MAG_R04]|nr:hypothetical protein [Trichodesmium sp. MAG_R04]